MNENLIESSNIRFEQAEESVSLKIGQLKFSNQRTKKNKERKRMKNTYRTYETPLQETVYTSLESQEKRVGNLFLKNYAENLGEIWTSCLWK